MKRGFLSTNRASKDSLYTAVTVSNSTKSVQSKSPSTTAAIAKSILKLPFGNCCANCTTPTTTQVEEIDSLNDSAYCQSCSTLPQSSTKTQAEIKEQKLKRNQTLKSFFSSSLQQSNYNQNASQSSIFRILKEFIVRIFDDDMKYFENHPTLQFSQMNNNNKSAFFTLIKSEECFMNTLFPGMSSTSYSSLTSVKEASSASSASNDGESTIRNVVKTFKSEQDKNEKLNYIPKSLNELFCWHLFHINYDRIITSCCNVLNGVKARGLSQGDIMDKETEAILLPSIVLEALGREIVETVHLLSKAMSAMQVQSLPVLAMSKAAAAKVVKTNRNEGVVGVVTSSSSSSSSTVFDDSTDTDELEDDDNDDIFYGNLAEDAVKFMASHSRNAAVMNDASNNNSSSSSKNTSSRKGYSNSDFDNNAIHGSDDGMMSVHDCFLGHEWCELIYADALRFLENEHMSEMTSWLTDTTATPTISATATTPNVTSTAASSATPVLADNNKSHKNSSSGDGCDDPAVAVAHGNIGVDAVIKTMNEFVHYHGDVDKLATGNTNSYNNDSTSINSHDPSSTCLMAWIDTSPSSSSSLLEDLYPALAEAVKQMHRLPYKINELTNCALSLRVPLTGSTMLVYYPRGAYQPVRLDCNPFSAVDSGIRVTCAYTFTENDIHHHSVKNIASSSFITSPTDKPLLNISNTIQKKKNELSQFVYSSAATITNRNTANNIPTSPHDDDDDDDDDDQLLKKKDSDHLEEKAMISKRAVLNDQLIMHLSTQLRNGRSRAKEAYFVLYLFSHTLLLASANSTHPNIST